MTVSRLAIALGGSLLLHATLLGVVLWSAHSSRLREGSLGVAPASSTAAALLAVEAPPSEVLPSQPEVPPSQPEAPPPQPEAPSGRPSTPSDETVDPSRLRDEPNPSLLGPAASNEARPSESEPLVGEPRKTQDAVTLASSETTPEALRQAMQRATERKDAPSRIAGFGSMQMLLKERRLERALTWVFPKIVSEDKSFWRWPLGHQGTVRFVVVLSSEGRLVQTRFDSGSPTERLGELVTRMTRFLSYGRFELGSARTTDAGNERSFELTVTHEGAAGVEANGEIDQIGFDPPQAGRPGRGYVAERTGHRFVGRLTERSSVESTQPTSPEP